MNLEKRLQRSRDRDKIDFSKFLSINRLDPLVKVMSSQKILVKPNWTTPGDFEGAMYADYIAEHPEYDGIYVRSELLKRLELGASSLANPYKLIIRAGHRPMVVQKRVLNECIADFKKNTPGASDEEALEHARIFVSDPVIKLPPHVCGAAVDVEIIDSTTGKLLDFGSQMNDDNEKSYLYYPELTDFQKNNRLLLITAMLRGGLASLMSEWWHFSYGDQVWAWFYGKRDSLYSPVDI